MTWEYELAGYIWGEGTVGVYTYNTYRASGLDRKGIKRKVTYFRPLVKIAARKDDIELLRFLQDKLGGYLYDRKPAYKHKKGNYVSKPSCYWSVQDIKGVRRICDILSKSHFPAKKRKLLPLMYEFLDIADGKRYTPEQKERVREIIKEMKAIRAYSE
jgi:hypothetical protein